jgi:hypothetical protein
LRLSRKRNDSVGLILGHLSSGRSLTSEFDRQKGELQVRQGNVAAAEDLHRKALIIATEQGAKFWELPAAASLARLCRDQGRHAEARDVPAPILVGSPRASAPPI